MYLYIGLPLILILLFVKKRLLRLGSTQKFFSVQDIGIQEKEVYEQSNEDSVIMQAYPLSSHSTFGWKKKYSDKFCLCEI